MNKKIIVKRIVTASVFIFFTVTAFFIGSYKGLFTPSSDSATEAELKEVKTDLQQALYDKKTAEDKLKKAKKTAESNLKGQKKENDDELKEVKAELKKVKAELKKVKSESKNDIYKNAFNTIFYDTKERFIMNNPDFHFYSNQFCTPDSLIKEDLTFVNSRDEDGINDSGLKVFVSRSTQGPVYSTEQPFFNNTKTEN